MVSPGEWLRGQRAAQTAFLAELVRIPVRQSAGRLRWRTRNATAELLEAMGFSVERHTVPAELVRAHGMISVTNLVVRQPLRRRADDRAERARRRGAARARAGPPIPTAPKSATAWMYGRGAAVSKSDFATYAFALPALRAIGAPLARHGRAALHLRRGNRRRARPRLAAARRASAAPDLRDLRRLLLRCRQRP